MAEDRVLTVTERIDSLVIQTAIKGMRPVALLLGPEEMKGLIDSFFPAGRTAVQTMERQPKTYAGLPVSEQIGIDGIVVVTHRTVGAGLPAHYVGAYPIIF